MLDIVDPSEESVPARVISKVPTSLFDGVPVNVREPESNDNHLGRFRAEYSTVPSEDLYVVFAMVKV